MTRNRNGSYAPWLVPFAAMLWLGHGAAADARPRQGGSAVEAAGDDFEAALRRAPAARPAQAAPTTSQPPSRGGGRGRAFARNHLPLEQRRAIAAESAHGIVPTRFMGKPASPAQLDAAYYAIQTKEMDSFAYLLQATAGTPLPPEAKPVRCASDERSLFYTLGVADPDVDAYVAAHSQAWREQNGIAMPAPASGDGPSMDKVIARAATFMTAHGYRPAPSWLEPKRFVPNDARAGVASVRVSIVGGLLTGALGACAAKGAAQPPSGPAIKVSLYFPGGPE